MIAVDDPEFQIVGKFAFDRRRGWKRFDGVKRAPSP